MRTIVALALLAVPPAAAWAQQEDPDAAAAGRLGDPEFDDSVVPFLKTRAGGWISNNFELDSVTSHGPRHISGNGLVNIGADIGATLRYDRWAVWASYDAGISDDMILSVVGANVGYRFSLDTMGLLDWPVKFMVSGGFLWGDVHVEDFSDFESDFGWRGGLNIIWNIPALKIDVELYFDGRWIRFDIEDTVFSGDEEYGGSSFASGVAVSLRF